MYPPKLRLRHFSLAIFLGVLVLPSGAQECYPDRPTQGIPRVGAKGITETVGEIMLRDELNPFKWDGYARLAAENEVNLHKVQAPGALNVTSWPPNRGGGNGFPENPQTIGANFTGATLSESGFIPPDSVGDVGPSQVMVAGNGRIKVFSKTGVLGGLNTTMDTFFNSVRNGSGVSDPQIRYDRLSGRWFVVGINTAAAYRICIAVSSSSTITNLASFTFFFISSPAGLADYPSLGVDANALYIGTNQFNPGYVGSYGYVVRKSSITGGGPIVVTTFANMATGAIDGPYSPRGVDQDDPASTQGYFAGVGSTTYGTMYIRRITNPGTAPTISANLLVSGMLATGAPIATPTSGAAALDSLDDRLFYARMRKNKLTGLTTMWTAHNIQVNAAGASSATGGRNGSRFYEVQNMTGAPSMRQAGVLFDSAAASPLSYWIPSCAMSGQGHMALACSRSSANTFAMAYTAGRFGTDTLGTIQAPTQIVSSSTVYSVQGGVQRWGDYSMTGVDPNDDMTMWTFQEYCNATNSWAVRVTQLKAPPPASISTLSPNTLQQGATDNIIVTGTSSAGSGFYDPDAAFANHIAAAFSGAGVTVNSITFTDPTHITLNVTASGGAATGLRNLTVTNPDAQSSIGNNVLTITAGTATVAPANLVVNQGTVFAGGLAQIVSTDDTRLDIYRGPAQITVEGTSPILAPTNVAVTFEGHNAVAGQVMTSYAWNFVTNMYEQIDSRVLGTSDASFVVNLPNPAQCVDGAGLMRLMYICKAGAPTSTWHYRVDKIGWTITP